MSKRALLYFLTLLTILVGVAAVRQVAVARAAAVIDEGGYYNVRAYGTWVFEHSVYGQHHCCAATLTDEPVISEDVQAYDSLDSGAGYHVTYHGWSEDGWVHWQQECYAEGCGQWYIVSVGY